MNDTGSTAQVARDEAEHRARQLHGTAKDEASELADEAAGHARDLADQARQVTRRHAETQGDQVASATRSLAGEMRSMADGASDDSTLGKLMAEGAGQLERLTGRYDREGLQGIGRDLRAYARRSPTTFLLSTFAAGFAAGRVLRNADEQRLGEAAKPGADDDHAVGSEGRPHSTFATTVR